MESNDLEKFTSMTFPLSQYRLGLPLSKHKALAPTSPRSWDLRRRQLRDGARLWYVTSRRRRRQRCDLRNSVPGTRIHRDPPRQAMPWLPWYSEKGGRRHWPRFSFRRRSGTLKTARFGFGVAMLGLRG